MEAINYKETGGSFGVSRVLGTFTLHTNPNNGRILVTDDYQNGKFVGFGYTTPEDAVKAFTVRDSARLLNL